MSIDSPHPLLPTFRGKAQTPPSQNVSEPLGSGRSCKYWSTMATDKVDMFYTNNVLTIFVWSCQLSHIDRDTHVTPPISHCGARCIDLLPSAGLLLYCLIVTTPPTPPWITLCNKDWSTMLTNVTLRWYLNLNLMPFCCSCCFLEQPAQSVSLGGDPQPSPKDSTHTQSRLGPPCDPWPLR